MFFCRANAKNCNTLKDILRHYEAASGQQINVLKSSITFSAKAPHELRTKCKRFLGITNEGGVDKYLGLPENFRQKKKDIFASVVDKIKQRAESWSSKFLSSAGKMVLLKTVLLAIPNYTLSCFKIPVSLCKKIQSMLTRFWWDGHKGKKKMSWEIVEHVAWNAHSKTAGLGIVLTSDVVNRNTKLQEIVEHVASPLIAEGLAIRTALSKAIHLELLQLHIYSDSKECINSIVNHSNHRELYGILEDIRHLSSSFSIISFNFIPRTSNLEADTLAKLCLKDFLLAKELAYVPSSS